MNAGHAVESNDASRASFKRKVARRVSVVSESDRFDHLVLESDSQYGLPPSRRVALANRSG